MAIKRPKTEEIVVKLRQVEVRMGQGLPKIDAIAAKQPRDSKDVHSKRQKACEMFLRVNGDKPINDYDKLHMIEMARFMDNDDTGRQWANVTIKNYVPTPNRHLTMQLC